MNFNHGRILHCILYTGRRCVGEDGLVECGNIGRKYQVTVKRNFADSSTLYSSEYL